MSSVKLQCSRGWISIVTDADGSLLKLTLTFLKSWVGLSHLNLLVPLKVLIHINYSRSNFLIDFLSLNAVDTCV